MEESSSFQKICRDNPDAGLRELRAIHSLCFPAPAEPPFPLGVLPHSRPPLQFSRPQGGQSPVSGVWSQDEILSAARWIFQHPRLVWSDTLGPGGHKQIRTRYAIMNHWNTGAVNVQGRAHMVARQLESTRVGPSRAQASDPALRPPSKRRKPAPSRSIPRHEESNPSASVLSPISHGQYSVLASSDPDDIESGLLVARHNVGRTSIILQRPSPLLRYRLKTVFAELMKAPWAPPHPLFFLN